MTAPDQSRVESILHRLRNRLRERGEDVQLGLQRYAVERFLYRLGESSHRDRFVLKGGALFPLWGGAIYRATRDIDFTGYGSSDEADVLAAMREICEQPSPGEQVVFDAATLTVEPISDESEYHGLRVRLEGRLGDARIPMQIDIGFGNAIEPQPEIVTYPTLLADPAPRIQAYPREAVIAEKFHTMVLEGERNSRLKDFYDVHVLAQQFPFAGAQLGRAIAATFERRRTAIEPGLPAGLSPRFFSDRDRSNRWRTYLTNNSLPSAPVDFSTVGEGLRGFLGPLWSALGEEVAFDLRWPPGGPWR